MLLRMEGIVKIFPGVLANDHVDFDLEKGEVHALLGENGAGKTTLMNILYGLYRPEEGHIYLNDQEVRINSPLDAINLGIGMVHQHFTLVPPFTVVENVVLGLKSPREPFLDLKGAAEKIKEIADRYNFKIDPWAKVWQLSVGEKQRVEIIKALYRGANILILDEPTAVLTPQEADELFEVLRDMKKEGKSVVFISHKLDEVMKISDRVTVLRDGKAIKTLMTKDTSPQELAKIMVGREVIFTLSKSPFKPGEEVIRVEGLRALNDKGLLALNDVSFSIRKGEILGIAGVSGNGQKELEEVIYGLRPLKEGKVYFMGEDITGKKPEYLINKGIGYIPEDRMERGLILDFEVKENAILETHKDPPFARNGFLNYKEITSFTQRLIEDYNIKVPAINAIVKVLSGGNLQKLILGREISRKPLFLIASQPTRGLDIGATEYIRKKLLEERDNGKAILLISEDLEEVLSLSDRILVIYEGKVMGILDPEFAKNNIEKLGLLMAGVKEGGLKNEVNA